MQPTPGWGGYDEDELEPPGTVEAELGLGLGLANQWTSSAAREACPRAFAGPAYHPTVWTPRTCRSIVIGLELIVSSLPTPTCRTR